MSNTCVLGRASAITPPLKELIDLILVKRPLYTFDATGFLETMDTTGAITKVWANKFEVFQDAESVGTVAYYTESGRRQADGTRPDVFSMNSPLVESRKGKHSSDIRVACKVAMKILSPPTRESMCMELLKSISDGFSQNGYHWRTIPSEISSYSGGDIHKWIIESHIQGKVLPMPASCKIEEKNLYKYDTHKASVYLTNMANLNSRTPSQRKGHVVKILVDNSMYVLPMLYDKTETYEANGSPLIRYRNYEDMPVNIQEKVAILKIAKQDDPIQDTGVKFSDNIMYVVV